MREKEYRSASKDVVFTWCEVSRPMPVAARSSRQRRGLYDSVCDRGAAADSSAALDLREAPAPSQS